MAFAISYRARPGSWAGHVQVSTISRFVSFMSFVSRRGIVISSLILPNTSRAFRSGELDILLKGRKIIQHLTVVHVLVSPHDPHGGKAGNDAVPRRIAATSINNEISPISHHLPQLSTTDKFAKNFFESKTPLAPFRPPNTSTMRVPRPHLLLHSPPIRLGFTPRCGAGRWYSVHPRAFDDSASSASRPKVTLANLRKMYMTNQKIAVMTAYDFPSGTFADRAGSDIVLVGDSLGMVALGYESTNQVTLSVIPSPCLWSKGD
jgi:Ketopantoate hydroxymethyltransferase